MINKFVIASSNLGKLREIGNMVAPLNICVQAQSNFAVPDVAETGTTFVENAIIKARHACAYTQLPCLADDSGLVVDALAGAPGIYSSRFAGSKATDAENIKKLLHMMQTIPDEQRSARFVCVMVLLKHAQDPLPIICQATWEGKITHSPHGDNGFGYDPIFYVPEKQCTSAELLATVKNSISHRAKALDLLLTELAAS